MRRSPRSHGILIIATALLGLAACADRTTQPRERTPLPGSGSSFAVAADAPAYDFGALGGASSRATNVNDSSAVVGFASDTSGYLRAFLWTPEIGMRGLNIYPGPVHSFAIDVNNKGEVVGYVDSVTTGRAFVWSATNGLTWLPTLGGQSTYAYGINDNGDVVGSSETATGVTHAFIWTATGGMRDLGTLGGPSCAAGHSAAYDLNEQRQVVGFSCADTGERAFVWTETGGMVNLGTLGGPFSSRAFDINSSGQVVGVAQTATGTDHAFLWTPSSGMRDLGTLGGDASVARGINDLGEIVGDSYEIGSSIQHGFLWTEAGGMIKLAGLAGAGAAYGISRSGQAVGWSTNSAGFDRATGWGFSSPPPPPPVNHPPVANAGGPYAGLEGSPIAFSGSSTDPDGDELAFSWTFGDGTSATTASASHAYADNGSFEARLTVVDSSGASHVDSAAVSITNVAPRVTAPASYAIYSGDTLHLAASFSDPGTLDGPWSTSVDWSDGTPTIGSTGNQSAPITAAHRYFRAGSYGVRVVVTDKDGGLGADTVAVEVARFPTVIDVALKDASNVISIKSGGQTVGVALLSTPMYDARVADPASAVITNGSGAGTRLRGTRVGRDYEHTDVSKDGRVDLVLYFYKSDMVANGDLTTATTKLVLLADDASGRQTRGEDTVSVKP